jgi:hypothetical protein
VGHASPWGPLAQGSGSPVPWATRWHRSPPLEGRPSLGPLDTWLYQSPPEWGVSGWTRGCTGALLSGESPIAAGDVVTPEPSRALEWGKSYLIRGSSGALPSRGAGPGAMGYVAVCRCTPCFRSWLRACVRGTRSTRYRQWPPNPPWERS